MHRGATLSHFCCHIKCLPLKTLVPIVLVVKTLNLMVKFVTVTAGIGLLWELSDHSGTWGGGFLAVHYMGLCCEPSDCFSWCLVNPLASINFFFPIFFQIQPACGFFEWVDGEIELVPKLLDRIDVLERELKTARQREKFYLRVLLWSWAGIVLLLFMCYLLIAWFPVDGLELPWSNVSVGI